MKPPLAALGLVATMAACTTQPSKVPPSYSSSNYSATRNPSFDVEKASTLVSIDQDTKANNPSKYLIERHGAILDAASTTAALSSGFVEMNPLITGVCGTDPVTIGICGLGGKFLIEQAVNKAFENNEDYDPSIGLKLTNTVGFLGGCNNLALLAGVVGPPALIIGVGCAATYFGIKTEKEKREKEKRESAASALPGTVFEKI